MSYQGRNVNLQEPPEAIIAAAERDYQDMCVSVAAAMRGARRVAAERGSEVEAFAEVYYELSLINPRVAGAMGAAAIVQLAMRP
ncbi:hypothetical protein [Rugosimonospora africana]|uniref:Uncharacterized protein n=1 Tax=Rugosimonospora africana TaxID=556532 RepID=A0A8J3VRT2_9ACTN|nr:hypothetical protein [Rugosimonospora africana]GIH15718.1 hypothetical protein Raf01_38900 [Rugosimonospora africana]